MASTEEDIFITMVSQPFTETTTRTSTGFSSPKSTLNKALCTANTPPSKPQLYQPSAQQQRQPLPTQSSIRSANTDDSPAQSRQHITSITELSDDLRQLESELDNIRRIYFWLDMTQQKWSTIQKTKRILGTAISGNKWTYSDNARYYAANRTMQLKFIETRLELRDSAAKLERMAAQIKQKLTMADQKHEYLQDVLEKYLAVVRDIISVVNDDANSVPTQTSINHPLHLPGAISELELELSST